MAEVRRSVLQLLVVVALLLAAVLPTAAASATDAPPLPAPARSAGAPPRAWVDSERGPRWLAYSSYCWRNGQSGLCVDYQRPSCGGTNPAPRIALRRGEVVHFVLGFKPRQLSVNSVGAGSGQPATLVAKHVASWRADRPGAFALFATAGNGDASYVGCVVWQS